MQNETKLVAPTPQSVNDNILMSQEETRRWIAKFMVGAVVFIILIVLGFSFFVDTSKFAIFDVAISGLIGILGAIVGFYFGNQK